jgi:hypothetical protein
MADWQPIETAPKDGTWVLSWGAHHGIGIARHNGLFAHMTGVSGWDGSTHWQPLPDPPSLTPNSDSKEEGNE